MSRYGVKPRIGSLPRNDMLRGCTSLFALQYGEAHPFDLVNGLHLTNSTGTTSTVSSPVGRALRSSSNQASRWGLAPTRMQSTSASTLWFGELFATAGADACLGGITHNGTNAPPYVSAELKLNGIGAFYLATNDGTNQVTLYSPVAPSTTGVFAVIGTQTSGSQRLYVSGLASASSSVTGNIAYGSSPRIEIGDSLNTRNPNSDCWMMATWNRALSSAEASEILRDPIALLRTSPRRTYSIPAASSAKPWLYAPSTSVVYGYAAGAA